MKNDMTEEEYSQVLGDLVRRHISNQQRAVVIRAKLSSMGGTIESFGRSLQNNPSIVSIPSFYGERDKLAECIRELRELLDQINKDAECLHTFGIGSVSASQENNS